MALSDDQEGEAMTQCEKKVRELEKEAREPEIVAGTLLPAATRVYQHIPMSKRKCQWYCDLGVASFTLIAGRISFTHEGLRDFLQEPECLKEKVFCILSVILWHCSFESLEGPYNISIVEFVIFLGDTLSLFSIEHF